MDKIREKELRLSELELEEDIQKKKTNIAEAKRLEKACKREYGTKWRSLLGVFGKLTDAETRHSLYAMNPNLKELTSTGSLRRL